MSGAAVAKAQITAWALVAATEGTVYTKKGFEFEEANWGRVSEIGGADGR